MISNRGIDSIYCSFLILFNSSNWLRITVRHWSRLYVFINCSITIIYFLIWLIIFEFISFIFISFVTALCRRLTSFIVGLLKYLRIWIFILRFSFLSIFVVYYFVFELIIVTLWLLILVFKINLSIWIDSTLITIGSSSWLISISIIISASIIFIVFIQKL